MSRRSIETIWRDDVTPVIETFNQKPLFPSALIKLKARKVADGMSLPQTAIERLLFDTNRLIRICRQKFTHPLVDHLIVNCYPFSTQYITLAEMNAEIPNFAVIYAEEELGIMKNKLSPEIRDSYQVELDELTRLLIKDPTGFLIVDAIANARESKRRRAKFTHGKIINQVIAQGAERYKFIYSQLLLPQTDQTEIKK